MHKGEAPIRFAGAQLVRHRHVCAFFSAWDEEYKVMLPFIKDGFDRGDRAFHIGTPDDRRRGVLQENPFFVPPYEFLRELKTRGIQ